MSCEGKSVVIIGASPNPDRYANKAILAYLKKGYKVFAVNPKYAGTKIHGVNVVSSVNDISEKIDIAALYVRPEIGINVLEDLARKGVKLVYVNPGTGSSELLEKGRKLGMEMIEACAIKSIGFDPDNMRISLSL